MNIAEITKREFDIPPLGVIALADGIKNNGALEKLLMAKNKIATKDAGEALGQALAKNSVLKELDISGDGYFKGIDGPGFAKEFAVVLGINQVMTNLNISSNKLVGTKATGRYMSRAPEYSDESEEEDSDEEDFD